MKAVLLLSAALLLAGCGRQPEAPAPARAVSLRPGEVVLDPGSPKLRQIRVEPAGEFQVPVGEVDAPGSIEVNPNRISRVVTPVAGRVTEVYVRLGDAVREGQPVASIESPDADLAISAYLQADSVLGQMRANLIKAQADLDRNRDLYSHQAVAQKEVLSSENALSQAQAQVRQAEAGREQALRRLSILGLTPGQFGQKITLHAPVPGKVLEVNIVKGEFRNDTNQPLFTIADLGAVWIVSDVPESNIRHIKHGEDLEIELNAYPGELFHAKVRRIADSVDPTTRTVKVSAELNNPAGRLLPQMFGRIRHVEGTRKMPAVPSSAVLQGQSGSYLFVETSAGHFRQTPIQTGNRAGELIGITAGIQPGDRIVTDGVMLLKGN